ncbi:DUF2079 domain-containing protein [Solidesulfovibrio carbinolicus]|uniref:DUF2079 domain-containing protein n=1 Tax=Solidesulfovibrio carbinolicus TaxID=296842 RepID=A0A4P6HFX2_9BACT|nr:DUF2079 domain-containing protein [Solidesulfovibrio carbinolicus]QAZ65953.1 hypothetical protein C3Y92_01340 [Solidesulfovibrio carbinolicus]
MLKDHAPALLPEPPARKVGGAVFAGLFGVLAVMSCLKYLALHSTVFDLGVFLSNLHSLHVAGQWWRAFLGHAQPLLPVYAQVYRLVPDQAAPLVLLVSQAFVLALPAFFAGRRHGTLAALAYVLFFPVWTNALFDFHLDHLLVPILYGFLAAATTGRVGWAVVLGLAPSLVKEPYALTTICCGAYLWLCEGRRGPGLFLAAFGALYFYVTTSLIVPFCTADAGLGIQSGAFSWLGGSPGAALVTLITQPGKVLAVVLGVPGKWKYLFFLFGSLIFFPLLRPKLLLPALPTIALSLLSTNPSYYGWANHYTAGAAGVLFFAFCQVLGPVRVLARQSGAGAGRVVFAVMGWLAIAHVMLAPSPVSRLFWTTDSFAFSSDAYEPTARDAAILAEILKVVPQDPRVAVVSQNTLNWGALAERLDYNSFPLGVFEPHPVRDLSGATWADFWTFVRTRQTPNLPVRSWQAQYVLLDLTRPWFVLDRGCEFIQGACRDEDVAREFNVFVIRARQEFDTLYDQGGFLILRRPQPAPPTPASPPAEAAGQPAEGAAASPSVNQPGFPPAVQPATPGQPPAVVGSPATAGPGVPVPSGQTSATPKTGPAQATPAAPAAPGSVPAPAGPPRTTPESDLGTEIEVEVLDRFPSQRAKKLKPTGRESEAGPADQSGPGAGQPAPATTPAPSVGPAQADAPAAEGEAATKRRQRRPKPEALEAAPSSEAAPGQPAAATSGQPSGPASGQSPSLAPDAAPAGEDAPRPKPRSRRPKTVETIEAGQPEQPPAPATTP